MNMTADKTNIQQFKAKYSHLQVSLPLYICNMGLHLKNKQLTNAKMIQMTENKNYVCI
jgi:hypothetical protein